LGIFPSFEAVFIMQRPSDFQGCFHFMDQLPSLGTEDMEFKTFAVAGVRPPRKDLFYAETRKNRGGSDSVSSLR
jgi:hypothetical protein